MRFSLGLNWPPWDQHVEIFEAAGLRVAHHSIHDYRPTLRAWYDRLVENRDEAIRFSGSANLQPLSLLPGRSLASL